MTHAQPRLRLLRVLAVTGALTAAFALLFVYSITPRGGPATVERWQVGILALPWLIFFAAFLPLVHHSWFTRDRNPFIRAALRLVYWAIVAGTILIFLGIYGVFVFPVLP